ncbi:MAG TPA: hypothetical protein VLG44_04735 [Chlamydiales bacterium]|nr:hypothetical protein [Chlamydiales bacterium]
MAAQAISSTIIYSIKVEDLVLHSRIYYPKGSRIPEAIDAIKNLVHMKHVWLDQPILHVIAKKDYELTEVSDAKYPPSDNWQITLLGEVLLIQKDGVISVNTRHLVQQVVRSVDEDFEEEFNLGMDPDELKLRWESYMPQESIKDVKATSGTKEKRDTSTCVIL